MISPTAFPLLKKSPDFQAEMADCKNINPFVQKNRKKVVEKEGEWKGKRRREYLEVGGEVRAVVEDVDALLDDEVEDTVGTALELLGDGADVGGNGAN